MIKKLTLLLLLLLPAQIAHAVSFEIKNEKIAKTKILFTGFDITNQTKQQEVTSIINHVQKNLQTTDLFESRTQIGENFTSIIGSNNDTPDFEYYFKNQISAIIDGTVKISSEGNLEITVKLWDILDEKPLFSKYYAASPSNYHKLANVLSDAIFTSLTGEKQGHFDTKIAYIAESGNIRNRKKRLAIISFDGKQHIYLTKGKNLVLTPIISKERKELIYLRYLDNKAQIHALDFITGKNKKIGNFTGTTFAASLHPKDPDKMLVSVIKNGNSDIYELHVPSNYSKRLTTSRAIETTPSYSPDGKKIIYTSDISGSQKIYIMDANGKNIRKISRNKGAYSKPIWSPDGSQIAFTKIYRNQFGIGLMRTDGSDEKIIAQGYVIEGAKFSPNGRYLIYSKQVSAYGRQSIPKLFTIDILTGHEYQIPTPRNEGATDPDWQ